MVNITEGPEAALIGQIRHKRQRLEEFIGRNVPRKRRLLNVTIVGGTMAAALTTGPAVGGQTFTAWLTRTFELTSPAWQVLCGAAALCSLTSTVATQLLKSQHVEEHVARAQSARARLEGVEVALGAGAVPLSQATADYLRCVEETAFLDS